MAEFKLANEVQELVTLLRGDHPISVEKCAAHIQKGVLTGSDDSLLALSHVSSQTVSEKLVKRSKDPESFRCQLEELEKRSVAGRIFLLPFLGKLCEDDSLSSFLASNANNTVSTYDSDREMVSTTASETSIGNDSLLTSKDLTRIRHRLKKESLASAAASRGGAKPFQLALEGGGGRKKKKKPQHIPKMPGWLATRPFLTLGFLTEEAGLNWGPLDLVPASSQERVLIEDLIFCMSGIEGNYVSVQPNPELPSGGTVTTRERVDPSLRDLVVQIAPVALYYSIVVCFVEEQFHFKNGLVCNALGAAMRHLLKDYLVFVTQLETQHRKGELTLQKLCFYSKPALHTMEILAGIAKSIGDMSGKHSGEVLTLLHERTCGLVGDPKAQELLLYLTQVASRPYLEILEKWIYKGVIVDPYKEFLLQDNEVIQEATEHSDDYWEKRYVLCHEKTPIFLERVAGKILKTGKYLNVIRQCGKYVKSTQAEKIAYNINEKLYIKSIEKAYSFASKTLLDLLLNEKDLMNRLKSVKHYFLLDQGDFVVQFMDLCESELLKNINNLVPSRLESLLELALRTSAAKMDPYKDDVRVELLPYDLKSQMFRILSIATQTEAEFHARTGDSHLTGIEAFSFGYEVKWPVSLILNRKVLACYQMMFRHLFYCKHVERLLCSVWMSNKSNEFFSQTNETVDSGFALQQRMLNYVQNLEYYMTFEVLEPYWHLFLSRMQKVNNVDEVIGYHTDFINSCLKDCMLTNPKLLQTVNKLLVTCVGFCDFAKSLRAEAVCDRSEAESQQQLARFDVAFSGSILNLLHKISILGREKYSDKLVNILHRLDFNGFYTKQLEELGNYSASGDG